jgi:hypothetical protein
LRTFYSSSKKQFLSPPSYDSSKTETQKFAGNPKNRKEDGGKIQKGPAGASRSKSNHFGAGGRKKQ